MGEPFDGMGELVSTGYLVLCLGRLTIELGLITCRGRVCRSVQRKTLSILPRSKVSLQYITFTPWCLYFTLRMGLLCVGCFH